MKKTVADYPELVKQWDYEKNGDLKPEDLSYGSTKIIYWKCPIEIDHEWEAMVCNRTGGNGCPCCSGQKVVLSNSLMTTHPEIAKQWHSTKNGDITPFDLSYGSTKIIYWKCPIEIDHEWEATVNKRTNGRNCPCCDGKKVVLSNCLFTTHPEIAKQWHQTKNNLTPYDITYSSNKKVWWKCDAGDDHEWEASPNNRIKNGCPCCYGRKAVLSNCLATTHPEIAKEWHPNLNGNLSPKDVTFGSGKKVWWKCESGDDHEWEASPNNRTNGTGCPRCDLSKGEIAIGEVLTKLDINFYREFRIKRCKSIKALPFDFMVLPENKFCGFIEYQGEQHFGWGRWDKSPADLINRQIRDQIKRDFCKDNHLPYLEIHYLDFDKIPQLVTDFVKSLPKRRSPKG